MRRKWSFSLLAAGMMVVVAVHGRAVSATPPFYILALNWQPAFCEMNAGKPECRSQTKLSFDAGNFVLHGLWPQSQRLRYCNVPDKLRQASAEGRWRELPALPLSVETAAELDRVMPGRRSFLDRHEFVKHGTCHAVPDAEIYFRDSLRLLRSINASPVRELMNDSIGNWVSARQIRDSFDRAFGPGAGDRVRVVCRHDGGRRLISEITIGLRGDIPGGERLEDMLQAAPSVRPGCPGGVVDAVGLQ